MALPPTTWLMARRGIVFNGVKEVLVVRIEESGMSRQKWINYKSG